MSTKWTLKYSSAAVITAIIIILIALVANPPMLQTPTYTNTNFVIMLTDPPDVPAGTTTLSLTYSDIKIHITYPNKTAEWLVANVSGNINLLSLINMTQTLTNITIPTSSTIDKIQFTMTDIEAVINEITHNVTALSNTLTIEIANGYVNQTLSGVLIDFTPILVEIESTDDYGALINYYVLVPSATAVIIEDIVESQLKAGTILKLKESHKTQLANAEEEFKKNVNIISTSLAVNDDTTTLTVTLKNEGTNDFRIVGATLHGEFKTTQTQKKQSDRQEQPSIRIHPRTIPFKPEDTSLVPLPGITPKQENEHETPNYPEVTLEPEETISLTFADVIILQPKNKNTGQTTIITPIVDNDYRLKLMGQGFQTIDIIATP